MTGDEIIGEILATNSALIPITVTDLGQFGSLFERFLYGTDARKLPTFGKDRVHARKAALLARSTKVPSGILPHANKIWRHDHPGEFYGFSYKAMDPMTYAKQQLGLIASTAVANQILRAHRKIKSRPPAPDENPKVGNLLRDGASYLPHNVSCVPGGRAMASIASESPTFPAIISQI